MRRPEDKEISDELCESSQVKWDQIQQELDNLTKKRIQKDIEIVKWKQLINNDLTGISQVSKQMADNSMNKVEINQILYIKGKQIHQYKCTTIKWMGIRNYYKKINQMFNDFKTIDENLSMRKICNIIFNTLPLYIKKQIDKCSVLPRKTISSIGWKFRGRIWREYTF